MKTNETESTLLNCFEYADVGKLPELIDEKSKNWIYGIALVKRKTQSEDYVIVKNLGGKASCIRSFSKLASAIIEYEEIRPYVLYDVNAIPNLKTIDEIVKYLLQFYTRYQINDKDGKPDKAKMKALIIRRTIAETIRLEKTLNRKIKIEKEDGNKEQGNNKLNDGENLKNTKTNTSGNEEGKQNNGEGAGDKEDKKADIK